MHCALIDLFVFLVVFAGKHFQMQIFHTFNRLRLVKEAV